MNAPVAPPHLLGTSDGFGFGFLIMKSRYLIALFVSLLALGAFWWWNWPSETPLLMASVQGKVTLDGAPLGSGLIEFRPVSIEATPMSIEIHDGQFQGQACIAVSKVIITSGDVAIHSAYNATSVLSADVKEGVNLLDFKLKTEPKIGLREKRKRQVEP